MQRRRAFTVEFEVEAVRLMRGRRALGVPLTQISRELDVGPNQLRGWAREADETAGGGPTAGTELRRLQPSGRVIRERHGYTHGPGIGAPLDLMEDR